MYIVSAEVNIQGDVALGSIGVDTDFASVDTQKLADLSDGVQKYDGHVEDEVSEASPSPLSSSIRPCHWLESAFQVHSSELSSAGVVVAIHCRWVLAPHSAERQTDCHF